MIKNERQYRITKAVADRFEESLRELTPQASAADSLLHKAQVDAVTSQLEELRGQLEEYDALSSGRISSWRFASIDDLPGALIRARIASGLSQKDLADQLGLKEQQIQRYEATDYESASVARVMEIADALGLRLEGTASVDERTGSARKLFEQLGAIGFDRNFVLKRLVPESVAAQLEADGSTGRPQPAARDAAESVGRILGQPTGTLLSSWPLVLEPEVAGVTRFKLPKGVDERRVSAYTVYAHFLALLVLQGTADLTPQPVPVRADVVRSQILSIAPRLSLENALEYVWSLGIPVLPLNDPGAFHGACWRVNSRNVIVLKQRSHSLARWLFDLLHELWHAGQRPEEAQLAVVETGEISAEEKAAGVFAGNVMLDGRAEELADLCVEVARGSVERLKGAVERVATSEGVEADALANYMAFRLSLQGEDWWGAASNMQRGKSGEPWRTTRDFLVERLNTGALNELDRDLLRRALQG